MDVRKAVQLVDRKYLIDLLTDFIENVETVHRFSFTPSIPALALQSRTAQETLVELGYPVREAINAARPGLGNFTVDHQLSPGKRWDAARMAAIRARGIYNYAEGIRRSLIPDSPTLAADGLHPWVWESAKRLLESGHYVEAIGAALRTVNARLQQKIGRQDVSEKALVEQAFSLDPPKPDKPRLRMPGDGQRVLDCERPTYSERS